MLLLKIKNKQVKSETEEIDPRCFTSLDQIALVAPGYLNKHGTQCHPLGDLCLSARQRWNFLKAHMGVSPTLSKQIDWVSVGKFFVWSVCCVVRSGYVRGTESSQ